MFLIRPFSEKQYKRYFTLLCYLPIDLRTVRKTVSKIEGAELCITRSEVGLLTKNACTIKIRTLRPSGQNPNASALPTRPWFTRTLAIHFIHEKYFKALP